MLRSKPANPSHNALKDLTLVEPVLDSPTKKEKIDRLKLDLNATCFCVQGIQL